MVFFARFVDVLADIFSILIVLRSLVSWFPINPGNQIIALLYQATEPILAPLRRIIPPLGMFDITPIAAIILLQVIARIVRYIAIGA